MKIIRDSAGVDKKKYGQFGYGGGNRATQVEEFLREYLGVTEIIDIDNSYQPISLIKRIKYFLRLIFYHRFKVVFSIRMMSWTGYQYGVYAKCFSENRDVKLFVSEKSPSFISHHATKDFGLKHISIPTDIETQLTNYTHDFFTKQKFPVNLVREMEYLKKADMVICMSREEQWLLNAFRIKAFFLAYYPPQAKCNYYLSVREKRKSIYAPGNEFLIVSTVHHYPTRISLEPQLNLLASIQNEFNFRVRLVGYGTETFKPLEQKYKFLEVEGTVDNDRLEYLLSTTEAALIHQEEGSGALTKIPEYLVAGVPLIVNCHGARSAFSYNGVYVYDSAAQMLGHMRASKEFASIPENCNSQMEYLKSEIIKRALR